MLHSLERSSQKYHISSPTLPPSVQMSALQLGSSTTIRPSYYWGFLTVAVNTVAALNICCWLSTIKHTYSQIHRFYSEWVWKLILAVFLRPEYFTVPALFVCSCLCFSFSIITLNSLLFICSFHKCTRETNPLTQNFSLGLVYSSLLAGWLHFISVINASETKAKF